MPHDRLRWIGVIGALSSACGIVGLEPLENSEPNPNVHGEGDSGSAGAASGARDNGGSGGDNSPGGASSASGGAPGGGGATGGNPGTGGDEPQPESCEPRETFCSGHLFSACDASGTVVKTRDCAATFDSGPCSVSSCSPTVGCVQEPREDVESGGGCGDLVASFRFEDAVEDDTGHGNHPTTLTGVSYVDGVSGAAVELDGDSQILLEDSSSLDVTEQLTIEAWVHPYEVPADGRVGIVDNDGQWALFLLDGGFPRCSAEGLLVGTVAIPVGTWTHVACVYDGSALRAYVNGVETDATAQTGPMSTASETDVAIGGNSPAGDSFHGMLDSLRIWRRALSPDELCTITGRCR